MSAETTPTILATPTMSATSAAPTIPTPTRPAAVPHPIAGHTQASAPGKPLLLRFHPGASLPRALFDKLTELGGRGGASGQGGDDGSDDGSDMGGGNGDDHGTGNWLVLGGIGMLRDFELGYFDGKEYHKRTFAEPHELVSLQGTVVADGPGTPGIPTSETNETGTSEGGNPIAHLHAVLAGPDLAPVAGHLFGGVVGVTLEVNLLPLAGSVSRRFEPGGLALLQLENQAP